MPSLLEQLARARDQRARSEAEFRAALIQARERHSWTELAAVAGLSRSACRYFVLDLNAARKEKRKEANPDA